MRQEILKQSAKLHNFSLFLLLTVFIVYLTVWIKGHWGFLFDPLLQNDDVRTILFPFHRYGPEKALSNDILANEMMGGIPHQFRFLYFVFIKISSLYWASKWVQGLSLLIVLFAGMILACSKKGGVASGILLVFFVLHTPQMIDRIAGGLTRSFGFPLLALWSAGILTRSQKVRLLSGILSALYYPPVLVLILSGEGLFLLRGGIKPRAFFFKKRIKNYIIFVFVCLLFYSPYMVLFGKRGHIPTLDEAIQNPVFSHEGFLGHNEAIPFLDPAMQFASHFTKPFNKTNPTIPVQDTGEEIFFIVFFMFLVFWRLTPVPWGALSLMMGSVFIYFLSRVFAFQLYSPERYYNFGMLAVSQLLTVSTIGLLFPGLKRIPRVALRNFVSSFFILFLWISRGDGLDPKSAMTIEGVTHSKLFQFVRTLPLDAKIAAHPRDGDDIPYWAGRASTGGYETIHLWTVELFNRRKEELEDVLKGIYAVDRKTVFDFVSKYHVSHLLLNKDLFNSDFREQAHYFEPFGTFTDSLLKNVLLDSLVLKDVPSETIVFEDQTFKLIDVSRLAMAWNEKTKNQHSF